MVAIGCSPDVDVPVVTVDEEEGGYMMTQHLLSLGHRGIGFLCLWQMESASGAASMATCGRWSRPG